MKRVLSIILIVALLCTMVPGMAMNASAATTISSTPYAGVEYSYSAAVSCGTIRYISQIIGSTYFNWSYWPTSSLAGYYSPSVECGTACISMALSYIGVNKTPSDILTPYNGWTQFISFGDGQHSNPSFKTGMNNYIEGNGLYSPVVICMSGAGSYNSDTGKYNNHYIMITGKISDTLYHYVDPASNVIGTTTISGSTATYKSGAYSIIEVHQWYNPNANSTKIPVGVVDTVSAEDGNVRVRGWVYDRDDLNRSVKLYVYIGSTFVGEGVADQHRPDVNTNSWHLGVGEYHGYDFTCQIPFGLSGTQTVSVYAIDEENVGNKLLGETEITIEVPVSADIVYYDHDGTVWYTETADADSQYSLIANYPKKVGSYFSGWAFTPDASIYDVRPNAAISITEPEVKLYPVYVTHEEATSGEPVLIYNIADFADTDYDIVAAIKTVTVTEDKSYWTDWSDYSIEEIQESSNVEVRTTTLFRYYYYLCPNCGAHEPFYGTSDCGATIPNTAGYVGWFTTPYSQSNPQSFSYTSSKYYTTSLDDGGYWIFGADNLNDTAVGTLDAGSGAVVITTGYSSRKYVEQYESISRDYAAYIITPLEQNIASGICGDNLTWTLDEAGTLTISGTGEMYDFAINDGNYIYMLERPWDINKVVSVVIEDGATSIGWYAFCECTQLTEVTLPDSLITIGEDAFSRCSSLTSVVVPDSVTTIGYYAFSMCSNLSTVKIGDNVTSIGNSAFYECTSLTEVTIPNGVSSIGKNAFTFCSSLTTVEISESVYAIGTGAFEDCSSLTGIWVNEKNITYSSDESGVLFNKRKTALIQAPGGLSGAYTIPSSVTTISDRAFYFCTDLTGVTIPNSVVSIGALAFFRCTSLTSAPLGNSVMFIGDMAFYYCNNLTSMTIPGGVTSIGDSAFSWCTSLNNVIYCGTEQQWNQISIGSNNIYLTDVSRQYHDYQAATCTTPKTCAICGQTEGSPVVHNYLARVHEATCAAQGYTQYTCENCGDSYNDHYTPVSDHNYVITWEQYATCEEEGYVEKTCTVCGDETLEFTAPTGHSWTEATCTEPKVCSVCGELHSSALGHSWGDWVVLEQATCTSIGMQAHMCSACGITQTENIDPLGHSYSSVTTVPTCTQQGYTTYTCATCGNLYTADYKEALGHKWSTWLQTKAPSCTAEGSELRFCNCGVQETRIISKLSHSYENGACRNCGALEDSVCYHAQVKYTDNGDGTHSVVCSACGDIQSTEKHSYVDNACACGHEAFAWAGMSASLESSLQATFVVQTANLPESGYYALIEKEVYDKETGAITIETTRFEASDFENYNTAGTMKKIVFSGVAAKQMTDRFTVTIYNEAGEQISASYTRTIEEYILDLLGKTGTAAAMKTLCVDFLNYGAAAQDKFGYRTTNLANRNLTAAQKALATADSAVSGITDERVKGSLLAGTAVAAEYEIIPATVYQTAKIANVVKAEVSYVNFKGETVSYEVAAADFANYNTNGTMKKIEIAGTAVADGASPITVKLIDANGNVVDETVECVNYYCARMISDHAVFTQLLKVIHSAKIAFA